MVQKAVHFSRGQASVIMLRKKDRTKFDGCKLFVLESTRPVVFKIIQINNSLYLFERLVYPGKIFMLYSSLPDIVPLECDSRRNVPWNIPIFFRWSPCLRNNNHRKSRFVECSHLFNNLSQWNKTQMGSSKLVLGWLGVQYTCVIRAELSRAKR